MAQRPVKCLCAKDMPSNGGQAIGRTGAGEFMKITLTLLTAERIALRRFANATGKSLEDAAHLALREYLISTGDLELLHELDAETETVGSA